MDEVTAIFISCYSICCPQSVVLILCILEALPYISCLYHFAPAAIQIVGNQRSSQGGTISPTEKGESNLFSCILEHQYLQRCNHDQFCFSFIICLAMHVPKSLILLQRYLVGLRHSQFRHILCSVVGGWHSPMRSVQVCAVRKDMLYSRDFFSRFGHKQVVDFVSSRVVLYLLQTGLYFDSFPYAVAPIVSCIGGIV